MTAVNNVLQSQRQASIRAVTGKALDYNSDWEQLFDNKGIASTTGAGTKPAVQTFNGRFLKYLNATLGKSYTNLPQAMQSAADSGMLYDWNSIGTFTP